LNVKTVLVTGATGFVGTALCPMLASRGFRVRLGLRRPHPTAVLPLGAHEAAVVGAIDDQTDWREALRGANTVVHLAARVHVMRDTADSQIEYRRVNARGSMELARQAAAAGVARFVFLSSIKVNGELGVYTEADPPTPQDAYGVSKHEAEIGLREIAGATGMEVVIIRPPLVYGPGVRANFYTLMRVVGRGMILPLGAIHNRRSFVALDNLVDFIITCIDHPAAANQTFLVSDGEDLTTTDLIRRLARVMDRPARLIPVPMPLLMARATLLGKRAVAQRLLGSLQADMSKARKRLGWTPPISVDEGLRRTAAYYLSHRAH